jgi:outer membrane biosynthesis protein TonB
VAEVLDGTVLLAVAEALLAGESQVDIARRLGVSAGTVTRRRQRLLARMAATLRADGDGGDGTAPRLAAATAAAGPTLVSFELAMESRDALELEDKKRQLADAKDKLQTQIKTFGAERATVAKQRADLQKKAAEQEEKQKTDEEKLKDQQTKIEEQTKTIDEQNDQIKQLEEKPGDKNNK